MAKPIPKYPIRFLRWFCHPDYLEDLEGDIYERFDNHSKQGLNARLLLALDVLRLFRPSLIRPLVSSRWSNLLSLLYHHLKVSSRSLRNDHIYSAITIAGLVLSISSAIMIYHYVEQERSFDRFHANHQSKYRLTTGYTRKDEPLRTLATTPPSLTPILSNEIPEVIRTVRLFKYPWDLTITADEVKFREQEVLFVEPEFLALFDFELVRGNPKTCLSQIRTMVMTESAAEKYFGYEDPIGKFVTIDGASSEYKITGLIKSPPINSHIQFDFLISYETIDWWWEGEAKESWSPHEFYTYIELNSKNSSVSMISKLNRLASAIRSEENESTGLNEQYSIQPISSIHLEPALENELSPQLHGNSIMVDFLSGVSWFILIIGWINYINLATAKVSKRAQDIGIKKVLGVSRTHLTMQFLTEAVIINCISLLLGLLLFFLALDYFELFTGTTFNLPLLKNPHSWLDLVVVWFLGALFSGLYPAILLSGQPSLGKSKERFNNNSGTLFRKILVVFQFATAITLIAGTFIIYEQLGFMAKAHLGFEPNKVIIVKAANHTDEEADSLIVTKHNAFINGLKSQSFIKQVASGANTPGEEIYDAIPVRTALGAPQGAQSFNYTWVGYDYFETLGISLLAGRSFSPEFDDRSSVIINESAARQLGYTTAELALNQPLVIGRRAKRKVIGVFEDYRQESFHRNISPMVIDLGSAPVVYYAIKYTGQHSKVLVKAEELFNALYPRDPFDYFFLDNFYNQQYRGDYQMSYISTFFAAIAILIACLGLYGLASFSIISRTKEIGIRKVLGAKVVSLIRLLFHQYAIMVAVASSIAVPIVYLLMEEWLSNFTASIGIGVPVMLSAIALVLLLAFLAVGSIVFDVARSNPIKALRTE